MGGSELPSRTMHDSGSERKGLEANQREVEAVWSIAGGSAMSWVQAVRRIGKIQKYCGIGHRTQSHEVGKRNAS